MINAQERSGKGAIAAGLPALDRAQATFFALRRYLPDAFSRCRWHG
jgi:hypothetical protein